MKLHLTIPLWALLGAACVEDAAKPADPTAAEAATANCAPVTTVRGEADDHATAPLATASADPCQGARDIAAVVDHVDALNELLEADDATE